MLFLMLSMSQAATHDLPIDVNSSFYNGASNPPHVLDLASLGITPGQTITLEQIGSMRFGSGLPSGEGALVGIFSASDLLLPVGTHDRVVDALLPGDPYDSAVWTLDHDVLISSVLNRPPTLVSTIYSSEVTVPPGATHLFVGVHDNLYFDNIDEGLALRITYPDTPVLTMSGSCPGLVTFDLTGFTPNGNIEFGISHDIGDFELGSFHPCDGAPTGLASTAHVAMRPTADALGNASFQRIFRQPGACSTQMRVLDLQSCAMTAEVQELP